jgi:hypothetical protein
VSPARQRNLASPGGRKKKLFDGFEFSFVDGGTGKSAAADAARDLLASQIRSCGGVMVSLTPKHVRGIDHRASRLVCLASSPKKTAQYLLALAVGAAPLSTEWPTRCMQDETLHLVCKYQLPPLRVPGADDRSGLTAPASRSELGRILPIERRVLRTAKGRDPLLLGVRASDEFTKEWYVGNPLVPWASALCAPFLCVCARARATRVCVVFTSNPLSRRSLFECSLTHVRTSLLAPRAGSRCCAQQERTASLS